jgi:cell division septation protein DedD
MEKRTKHRIIGLFTILGLITVLLPFFDVLNEAPQSNKLTNVPAFPNQAIEIVASKQSIDGHNSMPKIEQTSISSMASSASIISNKPMLLADVKNETDYSDKVNKILHKTVATKHTARAVMITGATIDKNGLLKLKNAAWVIQIGAFKDKTNAIKLVNELRANGYKAFIQQVNSSFGNRTRVYIGPELKQSTEFALADQLKREKKIQGIVIKYQPLEI